MAHRDEPIGMLLCGDATYHDPIRHILLLVDVSDSSRFLNAVRAYNLPSVSIYQRVPKDPHRIADFQFRHLCFFLGCGRSYVPQHYLRIPPAAFWRPPYQFGMIPPFYHLFRARMSACLPACVFPEPRRATNVRSLPLSSIRIAHVCHRSLPNVRFRTTCQMSVNCSWIMCYLCRSYTPLEPGLMNLYHKLVLYQMI
jgi:hypothetical protein